MKNRAWNRVRAFFGAYFWLPCPLCGKMFGGHEWDGTSVPTSFGSGEGVCPDCKGIAEQKTKVFYDNIQQNCYMDKNGNLHPINELYQRECSK
jgi:hypothetical protein